MNIENKYSKLLTMLSIAAILLTTTGLAANYNDLAEKGYRWVTVDGPYACPSKDDLRRITEHHTDEAELRMVGELRAFYLIEDAIIQVLQEDATSGMSRIRTAEIKPDVWTLTKFLSRRPIRNTYGVIETPEALGPIPTKITGDYGIVP
jgi:hypothetical protein